MDHSHTAQEQRQHISPTVVVSEPVCPVATSWPSTARWQNHHVFPELLAIDRCLHDEYGVGGREHDSGFDSIPESNWFIG